MGLLKEGGSVGLLQTAADKIGTAVAASINALQSIWDKFTASVTAGVNASNGLKEGGSVSDATLARRSKLNQQFGTAVTIKDTDYSDRFGKMRNMGVYTEDITWAYYIAGGSSTKTGLYKNAIIDDRFLNLGELNIATGQLLRCSFSSASATVPAPFVVGKQYLLSFYVWSAKEQWFWMRSGTSTYGHGVKYVPANQLTRVWSTFKATSTNLVDQGVTPPIALGQDTGMDVYLINAAVGINSNIFIGGIQIEGVPSNYKSDLAQIGDSTIQTNSGTNDLQHDYTKVVNRAISNILGGLLNVNVYNRGIGGQRLDQMDARWITDITPLKVNCREVHIQGGINDIKQGTRTLSDMQSSITSMVSKAIADGLEYKVYTCTPTDDIGSVPAKELLRQQLNTWIKTTYGVRSIDINSVVEDPENPGYLLTEFWGDGTHYPQNGRMSVARYIASQTDKFAWIRKPSQYQPIYTT